MADETNVLATTTPAPIRQVIEMGSRGVALTSLDDAWRFAQLVAKSGIAPKDFVGKPEAILVALQMGAELGLPPMASLQNIAVINGGPSVWGDCALAIVQSHPQYEWHTEKFEGEGEARVAIFQIKRKGQEVHETRFSMAEAKRAGLTSKTNTPWQTYPERMLQMRARGFGLRDKFADALRGMITSEEANDYPGTTINAAQIEQDPEKAVREEIDSILKARGFNEAQRIAHISKNSKKLQQYMDKLKGESCPANGSSSPAAESHTSEPQIENQSSAPSVSSVQSQSSATNESESETSGTQEPATQRSATSAQPTSAQNATSVQSTPLNQAPPSKPTSASKPAQPQSSSVPNRANGGSHGRFTF